MSRIALLTDKQHGLTPDDSLLVPVLREQGFDVSVEEWGSASTDWERFETCILRSCWDYHLRAEEFLRWLCLLEDCRVRTANPVPIVRWNHHKRYLKELERKGIPIVPTCLVDTSGVMDLEGAFHAVGSDDLIIKPCVSASSYRTHKVSRTRASEYQDEFEAIVRESGALIQPFLREVQASGEWSFVFFGRQFSHAVLKRPGVGEFRTQESFGGAWQTAHPTSLQLGEAKKVLAVVEGNLLYARVDMVEVKGRLLLGELELIEPYLFFGGDADAPARFVQALKAL